MTKMITALLALLVLAACDPDAPIETPPDAAPWEEDAAPPPEDGGLLEDASDAGSPPVDAWIPVDPEDAGLLEDAGADSGPPELDAGIIEPDSGGPLEPDAGVTPGDDAGIEPDAGEEYPDAGSAPDAGNLVDAGYQDAGNDAGSLDSGVVTPDAGPPDAGHDAGPPPCWPDFWEPNNTQATAALLATATGAAVSWNIDNPTFHGADPDWWRFDIRRTTTRPTRARVESPPGRQAWFRIRYVCEGIPTCGPGAARILNYCERVGLGSVELEASCPDLSAPATFYVEATRPSGDACFYAPTFSIEPG